MIRVSVTYFLLPSGKEYFPEWFDEVLIESKKQAGFIGLNYTWQESDTTVQVVLDFENQFLLDKWTKKAVHGALVAKIEPFLEREIGVTVLNRE